MSDNKENEGLRLLLILHSKWILIANIRRHPQNSLILTSLLLVATSGIVLFSGVSINMTNNDNQAQAQVQEAAATTTTTTTRSRADKDQQIMGNTR